MRNRFPGAAVADPYFVDCTSVAVASVAAAVVAVVAAYCPSSVAAGDRSSFALLACLLERLLLAFVALVRPLLFVHLCFLG